MGNPEEEEKRSNASSSSSDSDSESNNGEKVPYPKSVFFILSTEACERFSYYGMRAILSLYLKHLFILDGMASDTAENTSTILYHAFIFLSYFTSVFGAFLADSFLGKFRTIFYISIVYAIGQIILSIGAIPDSPEGISGMPQQAVSFIGLILIGFGTGGIKPCVVSFGADQFQLPQQKKQMASFFGIFYASINFGSMISTILTPMFRKQTCFGDECYSLAFGTPAVLMVVAIISFVIGRVGYKITIPERNIVSDFCKVIWKLITKHPDEAEAEFGKEFVEDCRAVLRVCVLFLMYPVFWALYDQQGSRWTFQATRMDGQIGSVNILPDQMQVINAVLILVFIPIFDRIIYPLFAKCGLLKTPLQKIITGGMLLAVAFVVSGILELILEKTYPHPPEQVSKGMYSSRLGFHNSLPEGCDIRIQASLEDQGFNIDFILNATKSNWATNGKGHALLPFNIKGGEEANIEATITINDNADCDYTGFNEKTSITVAAETSHTVTFFPGDDDSVEIYPATVSDAVDKSETGYPNLRLIHDLPFLAKNGARALLVKDSYDGNNGKGIGYNEVLNTTEMFDLAAIASEKQGMLQLLFEPIVSDIGVSGFNATKRAMIRSVSTFDGTSGVGNSPKDGEPTYYFDYRYGGCYNLYVQMEGDDVVLDIEEVTAPNSLHMLWLLPQYIILTAGEVLFSITSLAFAFTQAPESMKAVVQALFLLTNAFGNLIDLVVVAALSDVFSSQAHEFFLFAGLMVLDMLGLAFLASRYTYVDYGAGQ